MSLILKCVNYGPVQSASGAQGWFGEGYWFHRWMPGLNWEGCTFVAKTTTMLSRKGSMPIRPRRWTPTEHMPKCIIVKPLKGVVLNAVGLSGPGVEALLSDGRWQDRLQPFFLSFMSVAKTKEQRIGEAAAFSISLLKHVTDLEFLAPFGLQVNFSCPNTTHDSDKIAAEASEILEIFQLLRRAGVPIVPKFNVLFPVEAAMEISDLSDAICISNTIPWGMLPHQIDWVGLFGEHPNPNYGSVSLPEDSLTMLWDLGPGSPLHHLGGGGLSGRPLLPLVVDWVSRARCSGFDLPINAGGGILQPDDVDVLADAGASSVFLGSIAILRGWRVAATIRRAHKLLG